MEMPELASSSTEGDGLRRSKRNKFHLDIIGMQFHPGVGRIKKRSRPTMAAKKSRKSVDKPVEDSSFFKQSPNNIIGPIGKQRKIPSKSTVDQNNSASKQINDVIEWVTESMMVIPKVTLKIQECAPKEHCLDANFLCTRCPATYESRTGLSNHLKLHGVFKRYPCSKCDFSCENPKTMRCHRRLHGDESVCESEVNKETKKHNKMMPLTIGEDDRPPLLSVVTPTVNEMDNSNGHVAKSTSKNPPSRIKREQLFCTDCPFNSKNQKRLDVHRVGHNRQSGFKCPICSFRSTSAGFLKRHAECHGLESIPWPPVYEGLLKVQAVKKKPSTVYSGNANMPNLKPSIDNIEQLEKTTARNSKGQFSTIDKVFELDERAEMSSFLPKCAQCEFVAVDRTSMTAHKRNVHPVHDRFSLKHRHWRQCRVCGISFRHFGNWSAHSMIMHMKKSRKRLMIRMLKERKRLVTSTLKKKKMMIKMNKGMRTGTKFCSDCPFRTPNKDEMHTHRQKHLSKLPLSCKNCSFSTSTKLSLFHHQLMHKRYVERTKSGTSTVSIGENNNGMKQMINNCAVCPYKTKSIWDMRAHDKMHQLNRKFHCSLCSYNTQRPNALADHQRLHRLADEGKEKEQEERNRLIVAHEKKRQQAAKSIPLKVRNNKGVLIGERTNDDMGIFYSCRFCPFQSPILVQLSHHSRFHFGHRIWCCSRCSFNSNRVDKLGVHAVVHPALLSSSLSTARNRRQGGYHCRNCPFTAVSYPRLWHHMQKHKRKGKFTCGQCTFSTGSALCMAKHKSVHSQNVQNQEVYVDVVEPELLPPIEPTITIDKPTKEATQSSEEQCPDCPFSSSEHLLLKLHRKLHSGRPRPFACSVCSYSANMAESLYHHLNLHDSTIPEMDDHSGGKICRLQAVVRKRRNSLSNNVQSGNKKQLQSFRCIRCPDFRTDFVDQWERHRLRHVQNTQQRLLTTIKRTALEDTHKMAFPETKLRRTDRRMDRRQRYCPRCSFRCDSSVAFDRHCRMHGHPEVPFQCSVCDYGADHPNVVRFHEQAHHVDVPLALLLKEAIRLRRVTPGNSSMIVEPVSLLRCSLCSFETDRIGQLSDHWAIHSRQMDDKPDKTVFLLNLNLVRRSLNTQ